MFLKFSTEARARGKEVVAELGQEAGGRVLVDALHIAWDRLGPESEYESLGGRIYRNGCIEAADIDAARETLVH
jgi:hypothetical protein